MTALIHARPNRLNMKEDQAKTITADQLPADVFWTEAEELAFFLAAQLDYFETLGVEGLPTGLFSAAQKKHDQQGLISESRTTTVQPLPSAVNSKPAPTPACPSRAKTAQSDEHPAVWAPGTETIEDLSRLCSQCTACDLAEIRQTEPSAGQGPAKPLLVVVGPTPTMFQPDKASLLSAIMEKGLELSQDEYYAVSLLKCAPPDDQPPPPASDECCWPILKRQLELLDPRIILILGKKPAQQITGRHGEPFGLLRPKTHSLPGLNAFVRITYGLEDMMSDPDLKKAAWQDLKKIKIGIAKIKAESKGSD